MKQETFYQHAGKLAMSTDPADAEKLVNAKSIYAEIPELKEQSDKLQEQLDTLNEQITGKEKSLCEIFGIEYRDPKKRGGGGRFKFIGSRYEKICNAITANAEKSPTGLIEAQIAQAMSVDGEEYVGKDIYNYLQTGLKRGFLERDEDSLQYTVVAEKVAEMVKAETPASDTDGNEESATETTDESSEESNEKSEDSPQFEKFEMDGNTDKSEKSDESEESSQTESTEKPTIELWVADTLDRRGMHNIVSAKTENKQFVVVEYKTADGEVIEDKLTVKGSPFTNTEVADHINAAELG